jgi:hypothetical protein
MPMSQSNSINAASSLSVPLLAGTDCSPIADANVVTGVAGTRWWILFQYSSYLEPF